MASAASTSDEVVQQEILHAALRLYRKYGPNKVTMDNVATASGRSRTSLYYYYKNRDEIFQAVIDNIVSEVMDEIRQAVQSADNLRGKIHAFCTAKINTSEHWKSFFLVIWTMSEDDQTRHNKAMEGLHKKLIHQEAIVLNTAITGAMEQKQIRRLAPDELDVLVFIISSGIRGLRREIYDQNDPHDIKTAVNVLTDMVMKWLA